MSKRLIVVAVATVLCALSAVAAVRVTETAVPASDGRITYVGRTLAASDSVSFDWAGVYVKVRFSGDYLAVTARDTKRNYYDVWIDKPMGETPDKVVHTGLSDSLIVLCCADDLKDQGKKAAAGEHSLIFRKRTEGEQGTTSLGSFFVHGQFLQAEGLKPRQIEFIGDSYTCGYGAENSVATDPFKPETENQNLTYASMISRFFDADCFVVAHSGLGVVRNYNDHPMPNLPTRYKCTFDMRQDVEWDAAASDFKPALTVIYLCANDFSTGKQPHIGAFKSGYIDLLKDVKANYGDSHPILCVAAKTNDLMADYVREAVRSCGLENVSFAILSEKVHNSADELGASYHPSAKGHRKIACALIPYVSTMTGWDLPQDGWIR